MSDNPFEPSGGDFGRMHSEVDVDSSQAELIRKTHLSHEANIQSFGCLYTFGGVCGIIGSLFYIVMGMSIASGVVPLSPPNPNGPGGVADPLVSGIVMAIAGVVFLAISIGQLLGGRAMQKLNPKWKVFAIIISALGLLGFPCGTLISGYLLYLLLSQKGEMVFSDRYKEIIQATPHIKYKTSIIVWIFLFLLLGLIAFAIIAAAIAGA